MLVTNLKLGNIQSLLEGYKRRKLPYRFTSAG